MTTGKNGCDPDRGHKGQTGNSGFAPVLAKVIHNISYLLQLVVH